MKPEDTIDTLVTLLENRAESAPEQVPYTFLLDGETDEAPLSRSQLFHRARNIAVQLVERGIEPGDRALLLYPPGLEYISAFFGCLFAGVVAVPIYPPNPTRLERTLPRLRTIIADAEPAIALTDSFILMMTEHLLAAVPDFPSLNWLATDAEEADVTLWRRPHVNSNTLAFLQYTSGSTAAPKGVMLSHSNLLYNLALIKDSFGLDAEDRGIIWLPPYHDMGLIGGILQGLYAGGTVYLMSPLDFLKRPMRWLEAISRHRGTTSGGPNFAYDLCVRKSTPEEREALDLSSWGVAFNGAEPIRPETLQRFSSAFAGSGFRSQAFYPCYGLAEATLIVSGGAPDEAPHLLSVSRRGLEQGRVEKEPAQNGSGSVQRLVSSGRTLSGQQILIVNPDTKSRCLPDQVGEIWIGGPSVAQGYWRNVEASEETFGGSLEGEEGGPYLRSGDLGFLHQGELFVTGRVKDLIIVRGRNLYPQDIELTAEQAFAGLRPGCGAAFSVEADGEERLALVQEIDREFDKGREEDAIAAIRDAVSREHDVQVYAIQLLERNGIPKTPSGKVQRHACREGFLTEGLDVIASSTLEHRDEAAEPVEREESFINRALAGVVDENARHSLLTVYLQDQIARALQLSPAQIQTDRGLGSLGVDSMAAVELQFEVETDLGVELALTDVAGGTSVSDLARMILENLEASDR